MNKRIIIALLLALALLIGSTVPAMAAVSGSWKINQKAGSYLTSGEKTVFKRATKGLAGTAFTPVFRLAKQTVAGRNYAFLCKCTAATEKATSSWKIVFVNRDLKGKCKVLDVKNFNYKNIKTLDNAYAKPAGDGAWSYNSAAVTAKGIPSAANKAFNKAAKKYTGVELTPLALLGTQIVAGTNYKFLCRGVTVTPDSTVCLYEVNVCKNLKGKCSIIDCNVVNLPAYLEY